MRKDFKEKLMGKELAKAATPEALEEYRKSRLFNYIDNAKKGDPKTMKMIAEYNPNEVKYNSALGQFEKDGKRGALSDFVKPTVNFGLDKPQIFNEKAPMQNALKNVQRKGKRAKEMSDIDLIFSAADPKEKMDMRKQFKDYDFTQRKFKADIAKEQILKTPIIKPIPAPQKPIEAPSIDVAELIKQRADNAAFREKVESIREYGDTGLGGLKLRMEGLDD